MLRLLIGKLPLTDALWRVGVQLASKCLCCQEEANELVEHVFSERQVAMEFWNYFGRICGVAHRGSSLRAWLTAGGCRHVGRRKDGSFSQSFLVLYAGTFGRLGIKHTMKGFRCE